jgi:hypothetical protein
VHAHEPKWQHDAGRRPHRARQDQTQRRELGGDAQKSSRTPTRTRCPIVSKNTGFVG